MCLNALVLYEEGWIRIVEVSKLNFIGFFLRKGEDFIKRSTPSQYNFEFQ